MPYRPPPQSDQLAGAYEQLVRTIVEGAAQPGLPGAPSGGFNGNGNPVDDFRGIVGLIMQDCSKANIEVRFYVKGLHRQIRRLRLLNLPTNCTLLFFSLFLRHEQKGQTWIFETCHQGYHYEALMDFIVALSFSRPAFEDRLHLIYLVNDVLFHSERKQQGWIKDVIFTRLVPLLRSAFHLVGNADAQKDKVSKVITIWSDKRYFDHPVINSIRDAVLIPPPPNTAPPPGSQRGMPQMGYSPRPPPPSPQFMSQRPPPAFSPAHPAQAFSQQQQQQQQQQYRPPPPPPPPAPPAPPSSAPNPLQGGPFANQLPPGATAGGGMGAGFPQQQPRPPATMLQPPPNLPPVVEKRYYELPAGLIVPMVS
ncbi:hypothetical protein BC938DRAFT_477681, partial [Jimgerdemannia flammicorona]